MTLLLISSIISDFSCCSMLYPSATNLSLIIKVCLVALMLSERIRIQDCIQLWVYLNTVLDLHRPTNFTSPMPTPHFTKLLARPDLREWVWYNL